MRTIILFLTLSLVCANASYAERFAIKTGKVYEGDVIEKTNAYIKVKTFTGRVKIPLHFMDEATQEMVEQIPNFSEGQERPKIEELSTDGPFIPITEDADVTAEEILQNVRASYRAMTSYSVQGVAEDEIIMGGSRSDGSHKTRKKFSFLFKKPNFYKIVGQDTKTRGPQLKSAIWNAGEGPFVLIDDRYEKMADDQMAISEAQGITGGTTFLVASLFMDMGIDPLEQFSGFKLLGSQNVNGHECFVITYESPVSTDERLWISKDQYVIVRHSSQGDKNPGMPAFTGEQLNKSLQSMGMKVTDENKVKMKQMMDLANVAMKGFKVESASFLEEYRNIQVDTEIAQSEFNYEIPRGAKQGSQGELMEFAFDNLDGMKYSIIATNGGQLSAQEAAELESKLAVDPADYETRVRLLGYYFTQFTPKGRAQKFKHIKWIAKNKPDYPGSWHMAPYLDLIPKISGEAAYNEVKQIWLRQVLKYPNNVTVLLNAADYLDFSDKAIANRLIEKARAIDPEAVEKRSWERFMKK